jgi:hypothetical protein
MPDDASLPHHGMLIPDELFEFSASVLEGLCRPLDDGVMTIARIQIGLGQIWRPPRLHAMLGDALGLSSDEPECKIVPIPVCGDLSGF